MKAAHEDAYKIVLKLKEIVPKTGDVKELADIVHATDSVIKFCKDIEKEARIIHELAEKIGCAIWVRMGCADPIRTPYTTGTPVVKMMVSLPNRNKDPERFATFMESLGIARELWDVPADCKPAVAPNWPGMLDYVSELAAQGRPFPPGVDPDRTYPVYAITVTRRKEPDAE
jgi:hypothetical protein